MEWCCYEPYMAKFYDIIETQVVAPFNNEWDLEYIENVAIAELDSQGDVVADRIWVRHLAYDTDRRLHRLFSPSAMDGQ
jgi:hypothetical protein